MHRDLEKISTYGKKLYSAFFHDFGLIWHVLEVLGIVEEVLLHIEENGAHFDGALSVLFQLGQNQPSREKGMSITQHSYNIPTSFAQTTVKC